MTRDRGRGKQVASEELRVASSRLGIVGTHPGSFRKSSKQRTYRIRNLEECTENGRGVG